MTTYRMTIDLQKNLCIGVKIKAIKRKTKNIIRVYDKKLLQELSKKWWYKYHFSIFFL